MTTFFLDGVSNCLRHQLFLKIQAKSCFFFAYFRPFLLNTINKVKNDYKWKKHRQHACDSNLRPQNGRSRRIHCAIDANKPPTLFTEQFCAPKDQSRDQKMLKLQLVCLNFFFKISKKLMHLTNVFLVGNVKQKRMKYCLQNVKTSDVVGLTSNRLF